MDYLEDRRIRRFTPKLPYAYKATHPTIKMIIYTVDVQYLYKLFFQSTFSHHPLFEFVEHITISKDIWTLTFKEDILRVNIFFCFSFIMTRFYLTFNLGH